VLQAGRGEAFELDLTKERKASVVLLDFRPRDIVEAVGFLSQSKEGTPQEERRHLIETRNKFILQN
jgi:hypothetical protein